MCSLTSMDRGSPVFSSVQLASRALSMDFSGMHSLLLHPLPTEKSLSLPLPAEKGTIQFNHQLHMPPPEVSTFA